MKTPLFSIIIPVFNVKKYLQKCLMSVVEQSETDLYEVLIVDDGSTDGSDLIGKYFARQYDFCRYLYKNNGGLGSARNYGLDFANGEYVIFIDSDDHIHPDMVRRISLCIYENDDPDIVRFGLIRVGDNDRYEFLSSLATPSFRTILSCEHPSSACIQAFRRELFIGNGIKFVENILYEDVATTFKLFFYAKNISVLSEHLYYYCKRIDSITSSITIKEVDELFLSYNEAHEFLIKCDKLSEYNEELFFRSLRLSLYILKKLHSMHNNKDLYAYVLEKFFNLYSKEYCLDFLIRRDITLLDDYYYYLHNGNENHENRLSAILELHQFNSVENYKLSRSLNSMAGFLSILSINYKRIAIYGYGIVGRFCHLIIRDSICKIVDSNFNEINRIYTEVECPLQLNHNDFDIILICVLGREENIKKFLIDRCNVPINKIAVFSMEII
ncbi:glycosyltransferase [Aeromonas hydrophila]|uniref:glycosyltransferase family 2 protein n=2 Tax=Aeromonas hydrophila TaxID=644 RepID=UPI00249E553F|nr:glycosyltransferase [Aeromonas hydrophila]WGY32422.1 glycosyltransferase [Aeromonas hydrophila]HDC4323219.1 glycosyltransferase [Aeromonas hydrophila]